jgi:predicted acylesterase/phospholipase RssA
MVSRTNLRLALVMNGGVSLAVWMGGVTHEIDLLRRASEGVLPPPVDDPDRTIYDEWAGVCEALNVDVQIDIIAGSSAGGLNGTLLAAAIARGAPLPGLQDVWKEVAQLDDQHLLRAPVADEADEPAIAASVLSGTFFRDRVLDVFDRVGKNIQDKSPHDVTLFVTSTAVGPQPRRILDSAGSAWVVQDHRRLYKFPQSTELEYIAPSADEQRTPRFESVEFDLPWRDDSELLAHAAQASSSFPVAFPPVSEVRFDADDDANQLADFRVIGTGDAWLVDGGVLDNAPFGPVLDEIARAPIATPRKRALVYVVPSVDETRERVREAEAPGWQRVLGTALMLPREADLRDDVDAITRHSHEADRWASGPQQLFADMRSGDVVRRAAYRRTAATLLENYRLSRTQGGVSDALLVWAEQGPDARSSVPRIDPARHVSPEGWVPETEADFEPHGEWRWGTAVADRVLRLLLRSCYTRPPAEDTSRAMREISHELLRVAAIRDAVVNFIAAGKPDRPPTADDALREINGAIVELGVVETLNEIVWNAATAYLGDAPTVAASTEVLRDALTVEVVTGAFAADRTFNRPVAFDFFRFGPDIASPGIKVRDPKDSNKQLPLGPWKLWGTHLGHFAAFGREEWREDDWVWGRLDGMAHLVRLLDAQAGGSEAFDPDAAIATLQELFLRSQSPALTPRTMAEQAGEMARIDNDAVLAKWSGDQRGLESLLDVIDAILRTIRDRNNDNNARVGKLGDILTRALAGTMPPDLNGGLLRALTRRYRKRLVKALRNEP